MIGYITVGSNDLTKAGAFFDALLKPLGGTRAFGVDGMIGYAFGAERPMLIIVSPHDGRTATVGNGTMIALRARDRAQVDALHALALSLGAADEGAPGPRGAEFHGAYFRDLDGNKFNIHWTG